MTRCTRSGRDRILDPINQRRKQQTLTPAHRPASHLNRHPQRAAVHARMHRAAAVQDLGGQLAQAAVGGDQHVAEGVALGALGERAVEALLFWVWLLTRCVPGPAPAGG